MQVRWLNNLITRLQPPFITAAYDYNVTVVLSEWDFTQFNLSMSVESKDSQRNNFSYIAEFDHKDNRSGLGIPLEPTEKSNSLIVSLPYEVEDIKSVRFCSHSTSHSTFFVNRVEFSPIYMKSWMRIFYVKTFFSSFASIYPPMQHQTWYTLDDPI